MIGFNTDGRGLRAALTDAFGIDPAQSRIALLGAGGGAGQASARFLANLRPRKLLLVNRTAEKMEPLRRQLAANADVSFWDFGQLQEIFFEADLIINASSQGLTGAALDWDPKWLRPEHRVLDMAYRPASDTPLVTWARQSGIPAVDGRLMLLHQGAFAFEHWFGGPVPLEVMREALMGRTNDQQQPEQMTNEPPRRWLKATDLSSVICNLSFRRAESEATNPPMSQAFTCDRGSGSLALSCVIPNRFACESPLNTAKMGALFLTDPLDAL